MQRKYNQIYVIEYNCRQELSCRFCVEAVGAKSES